MSNAPYSDRTTRAAIALIKAQSNTYDQAVKLLVQLQDLARYREDYLPFQQRLKAIRAKYSRRTGLFERLNKAGLSSYS